MTMDLYMNHGIGVITMKNFSKFLFINIFVILLNSCSTAKKDVTKLEFVSSSYPWLFSPVCKELVQGDVTEAIKKNNSIGNVRQLKSLNQLESGRLSQLNSDYQASITAYNKAIESLPKNQQQSLDQSKKILLNRNTYNYYDIKNAYNIPDYAITFLYTYQALNYLETNNIKEAIQALDSLDKAKIWSDEQEILAEGMKQLVEKDLDRNEITSDNLGLENFKALTHMLEFSKRIPNAYGNPMSYYLKALLDSAFLKDYQKSLVDIEDAQQYTAGNKYLDQTANEFRSAIISQTSPFAMGLGRVVVLYEQGLVYTRRSAQVSLDLGNIGVRKMDLPVYNTDYNLFDPKRVIISLGDTNVTDTYTETLLDTTLFAMKSLVEAYSKVITQNVVIEAFKYDYEKNFTLGGLLGSTLKFDLSKTDPKRADLRSWLLLPNSIDLFEQRLDSGNYMIQVNNIRQKIDVQQGKTTLLWIVDIGKFKKVYYFIF